MQVKGYFSLSSGNVIEFEFKYPQKKITFTPLLICNSKLSGNIYYEAKDDLFVTLDLTDYKISKKQWQLIAERGLTLK